MYGKYFVSALAERIAPSPSVPRVGGKSGYSILAPHTMRPTRFAAQSLAQGTQRAAVAAAPAGSTASLALRKIRA